MRYIISFIFLSFWAVSGYSQTPIAWIEVNNQPLEINELIHDFGDLDQNEKCSFKFKIINKNDTALFLKHVTTSCGCTTPKWSKKPIKKGKETRLKIDYDSSKPGAFTKSIFVYTNFQDKPIKLQITGRVHSTVIPSLKNETQVQKHSIGIGEKSTIPPNQ